MRQSFHVYFIKLLWDTAAASTSRNASCDFGINGNFLESVGKEYMLDEPQPFQESLYICMIVVISAARNASCNFSINPHAVVANLSNTKRCKKPEND